ncbi:amidohydrolase family protein [Thermodesulfobacteriota bacterium]
MFLQPLPALDDPEGGLIPPKLPQVFDCHVHLFPDALFEAIWRWFDQYAWPIRYRLTAMEVIEFLTDRGIGKIAGLHYSHKPGMARQLNRHMAGLCERFPQVIGTATVFPGESETRAILEEGFRMGLACVKLHAHVQYFHMAGDGMHDIYEVCSEHDKPLIMHVGREPKSPVFPYERDPYSICSAESLERVLIEYPELMVCVPHMGADEYAAYAFMLEKYDNLYLDIAMTVADYLPDPDPPNIAKMRLDRIMYGTDFPNIPYAWDRELKRLCRMGLDARSLELVLGGNMERFFGTTGRAERP